MSNIECPIYKKHHNIIDGIYTLRLPYEWEEIPMIDDIDAQDEDGELYEMIKDLNIYDIEDIPGFDTPKDNHNIKETIFIIRRLGEYYLCETQGEPFVKFSTNISKIDTIKSIDRLDKIKKLSEIIQENKITK